MRVDGDERKPAVALQQEERPCFRLFQLEETMAADTPTPRFPVTVGDVPGSLRDF